MPARAGGRTSARLHDRDSRCLRGARSARSGARAAGRLAAWRRPGAAVRVLYVTDGENNPWAQLATEGRWPLTDRDRTRWGARRRLEALAGLERLGLAAAGARFLGFPDQGISSLFLM